jgi:hypothetical protein
LLMMNYRLVLFLAVSLALFGCEESASVKVAPVSGVVTLDGKPVPGATVTFQPRATSNDVAGPGSTAQCDTDGSFQLRTIRGDAGAVVGLHKVAIFPSYSRSPAEGSAGADSDTRVLAGPSIPDRYNFRSTLSFEVPVGGTTSADFPLTSTPD